MSVSRVFNIGLIDFLKGLEFQQEVFEQVKHGYFSSALILCRHYPVITVGRSGKRENIKLSESQLHAQGVAVCQVSRGGDVTYHGPGQLMAYPICNLSFLKNDIHAFLRMLEQVVISLVEEFGIVAERKEGLTGVWVGNKKIASLGIAVSHWITFHGFALNVTQDDLQNFSFIRPCGMDIKMTSMESELGRKISCDALHEAMARRFPYDQSYPS